MKNSTALIALFLYSTSFFGQILITDSDLDASSPLDCASNSGITANFFDSGNNTADYSANEDDTITICPDFAGGSSKMILSFGIAAGLLFDIDASDTIYVYDGPNTSAPLLGKHNSSTDPNGFTHTTSFANNPSSCFTIRFVSDGANEGIGWDANIRCLQLAQPFDVEMAGYLNGNGSDIINPSDTGYADICFGDSILYVATGVFPFSSDITGVGYSQNSTNVSYQWDFSDGSQATGDSIWFKPPSRNGFVALLTITDIFLQEESIISKVRVSTIPSFAGVLPEIDTLCVGDTTNIVGSVTTLGGATSGVNNTSSNFQLGGTFAGLTFLPDGNGVNFTTSVSIGGFVPGDTISSVSDLQQLNMIIEHSYLGDLEMILECPNGNQVTVFNSFPGAGGLVAGGFDGLGTFLGDANDDGTTNPGVGWEYKWSTVNATWGDFSTEYTNANFLPTTITPGNNAMNPNGIYLPEQSFAGFIGCPINGNWTITVRDNIAQDNGFIFEWELLFDPNLNPNNEVYSPALVSGQWSTSNGTILPGLPTDTFVTVTSDTAGTFDYIFQVTDDYGCIYDTTVQVTFISGPAVQADDTICGLSYQVTGTTSFNGGVWSGTGPGTVTFSNNTIENPSISITTAGIYTFTFIDNLCSKDSSFQVTFVPAPTIQSDDSICGLSYQITGTTSFNGGVWSGTGLGTIAFSNNTIDNPSISVSSSGIYTITFIDDECAINNSFDITFISEPTIPLDIVVCGSSSYQFIGTTSFNGGAWSGTGPGAITFSPNNTVENPLVSVSVKGVYTFSFTDNECTQVKSFQVNFPNQVAVALVGEDLCLGDEFVLDATSQVSEATYLWNDGSVSPTLTVLDSGLYVVTVTGLCNSETATALITTRICKIFAPNVITPNGDGNNDVLFFEGLEDFPGSSLQIFNRWGKQVYENNDYQNNWGPTNLSDGTYFYILIPGGGGMNGEILKSTITVLN